jgi:hypothetical protein
MCAKEITVLIEVTFWSPYFIPTNPGLIGCGHSEKKPPLLPFPFFQREAFTVHIVDIGIAIPRNFHALGQITDGFDGIRGKFTLGASGILFDSLGCARTRDGNPCEKKDI